MKIIKPGKIENKQWAKEEKCTGNGHGGRGCGAVLLLEEGDLYYTRSYCKDECDVYKTFTCPECQKKSDIKTPDYVKIHYDEKTWKAWQDKKEEEELQRHIQQSDEAGGK